MLRRLWHFFIDSRNLTIVGFVALAVFLYLGAEALEVALVWALALLLLAVVTWLGLWLWRRRCARRNAQMLWQAILNEAEIAAAQAASASAACSTQQGELDAVRAGMLAAIETIKTSKLGIKSGAAALYELPWYMIIGNPAAGKSSAILHSGLQFPFADGKIVQGVGGTRNCDWFFTTDGIVLDTAGRYCAVDEHRGEWFGFLDLLKKYRRKAPINGILIAVSIAELKGDPDVGMQLARSLRKRVQDVIERLEVFAPLYIVFTKADLIAGFTEFFADAERSERERVWGAMAIDVYLQIDGIKGESTDDKHKDWIECKSVSWSVEQPKSATASTGGGHTAERCEHKDIVISKLADLASPVLLQTCSAGKTIPKARFEFMRADGQGERVKYFEIEIENVLIGAVTPNVEEGDILGEHVGFKFSKVKWKYTQQKVTGGAGGNTSGGWDLAANRVA